MKKITPAILLTYVFISIHCITISQKNVFSHNNEIKVIKGIDTLKLPWAGGINAGQFSTIDLNLDGKQDLIIFDRSDQQVMPFINTGSSGVISYEYAPQYREIFPKSSAWMLLRDYNNDGKKDVFYNVSSGVMSVSTNITSTYLNFSLFNERINSDQHPSGTFEMYIPATDIPSISDIDGDGDLDVLTFGVFGNRLEYHRNYSVENHGHSDSLNYVLKNNCWGHFAEIGVSASKLVLYDTCISNIPGAEGGGSRHIGATVIAFDNNGDGIKDLLLSDPNFNNVVLGVNGGTAPNQNSSLISQDTLFPNYDTSINLTNFPGIFLEDIDNDGVKDLIASPNEVLLSENDNSVWFYKNHGNDSVPNYKFLKKNLLQDEMIEVGESAIPKFFDYNSDGLMDLIVSNYGYFNKDSITYDCRLSLFQNIGTISSPMYKFITDDYQNISSYKLGNSLHPTFGDIDGDGDEDMILGNSEGYLHFFTNTAGAGNIANFVLSSNRLQSNTGDTIDIGQFSAPQLFDYDEDGILDLIIGRINGDISYYQNIGTTSVYSFKRITDSLGGVEISEYYGSIRLPNTGYSTPEFFKDDSSTTLYVGSQRGGIYKYTGINPTNPIQTFIVDTIIKPNSYTLRSVPTLYDLKADSNLDMIVGTRRGGLNFFTNGPPPPPIQPIGLNEIKSDFNFQLYPNPANKWITIKFSNKLVAGSKLAVYNILGGKIKELNIQSNKSTIDLIGYKKGIYFIKVKTSKGIKTKKFIIQ